MPRKTFRILTILAAALGFMLAVAADPGPADVEQRPVAALGQLAGRVLDLRRRLDGPLVLRPLPVHGRPRVPGPSDRAAAERVRNSTKISCLPTSRLCAARARMGDAAYKCIEDLATRRMIFPSMIDSHNADHGILCVDGNGCTPEIINNMLIFAQPGLLDLLPAWRIVPRKQSFSRIPSG